MTDAAALVEDLKRPWRHGEHVDARKVVLDAPLVLDGLDIRGFDLSGAVLNGGISARNTRFRGLAWLRGASIRGTCDFSDAMFRSDFRGDGISADDVRLDRCHVQGVLSLASAKMQQLSLCDALVMANMTLEHAVVHGAVDINRAEIMGGLWTEGAKWAGLDANTADISGRIRLPR